MESETPLRGQAGRRGDSVEVRRNVRSTRGMGGMGGRGLEPLVLVLVAR